MSKLARIQQGAVNTPEKSACEETIKLNNKDVMFKLDTGAEVTVISDEVFSGLRNIKLEIGPGKYAENLRSCTLTYTQTFYTRKDMCD